MSRINGQRVLITGAGAGIGRLLAERVIARGGRVIAWDIEQGALDSLSGDYPDRVATYRVDLASKEETQRTAQQVIQELGGVDILVNNAGFVQGKSILDCDDEAVQRTFAINILAHFWTVRAFLPGMIQRGHGHIVTVASAAAFGGGPRMADYTASKGAAFNFDESLRLEFKKYKLPVKTTVVCPWYVDTGMFAGVKSRFSLFLPILEPQDVAAKMMRAIEKDRARLFMPATVLITFPLRLLPPVLFDAATTFLGVSRSMDEFVGHG